MAWVDIIAVFSAAFVGSAINSVAGGGTFITFPVLMFLGLTSIEANVTSTIALWPGVMASAYAYRKEWAQQKETVRALIPVSLVGGGIGAVVLLMTPEQQFRALVPWLLLGATLIFTCGRPLVARLKLQTRPTVGIALQFLIAIYGGYFGAGIGILMLAMLQLMGLSNVHRMNALKATFGAAINLVAVVLFIAHGAVVWPVALIMIGGALAGGYVGAALAQKFPPEPVRWLVIAIAVSMTTYFFLHG